MWKLFKVNNKDIKTTSMTFSWYFHCWIWTNKCRLCWLNENFLQPAWHNIQEFSDLSLLIHLTIFSVNLKRNKQLNQSCSLAFDCYQDMRSSCSLGVPKNSPLRNLQSSTLPMSVLRKTIVQHRLFLSEPSGNFHNT